MAGGLPMERSAGGTRTVIARRHAFVKASVGARRAEGQR
jgi:hypothetical protein